MPRKQYDILKDLFIAHREKDEAAYRERAQEYIRYLRWKKHYNIANEFEAIFTGKEFSRMKKKNTAHTTLPLFEQKPKKEKQPREEKPVWQVSNGIDINLIQTQRLLEEMTVERRMNYSKNNVAEILGYAPKKAEGFVRPLYFMGLLENKTKKPTMLALIIQKYDPYFDDNGTLWFLHYHISSKENYIIWNRLVGTLMQRQHFSLKDAFEILKDQKTNHSDYSFNHHIRREFRVITNAYTQSEFRKLFILQKDDKEGFIRTRPTAIPDEVLYSIILFFKAKYFKEEVTLEIGNLVYHDNAPARLLFLNEVQMRGALERLRIKGLITIESFADLDQIKFKKQETWLQALETYYKQKFGVG